MGVKQSVMSILDRNFSDQVFNEKERIEIWLLLEGVYRVYGYDFRNYAYPSIRRRILHRVQAEKLPTVSALQAKVLHDRNCLDRLMSDLVIHVTDLFRDPSFFSSLPPVGRALAARLYEHQDMACRLFDGGRGILHGHTSS